MANATRYSSPDDLTDDESYEMASLSMARNGLTKLVWVQSRRDGGAPGEVPRVKLADVSQGRTGYWLDVTCSDPPSHDAGRVPPGIDRVDIELLYLFIENNRELIGKLWRGEFTSVDFADDCQRV